MILKITRLNTRTVRRLTWRSFSTIDPTTINMIDNAGGAVPNVKGKASVSLEDKNLRRRSRYAIQAPKLPFLC